MIGHSQFSSLWFYRIERKGKVLKRYSNWVLQTLLHNPNLHARACTPLEVSVRYLCFSAKNYSLPAYLYSLERPWLETRQLMQKRFMKEFLCHYLVYCLLKHLTGP